VCVCVCVCVLQGTFDPTGPFLFSERADALTACAQFALNLTIALT